MFKRNIKFLFLFLFLFLVGFFYTLEIDSSNKVELKKEITNNDVKKTIDIEKKEQKSLEKAFRDEIALDNSKEENGMVLLYKGFNKKKDYVLSLFSDIIINEEKRDSINYLPIKVKFSNDEKVENFTISLKDSYKNDSTNLLSFELYSLQKNKTLTCDVTFLKELDFQYLYYMNIDSLGDEISCYIDKKVKMGKL